MSTIQFYSTVKQFRDSMDLQVRRDEIADYYITVNKDTQEMIFDIVERNGHRYRYSIAFQPS